MTLYRFISILDSVAEDGISTLDLSPEYLHIHIVKSDLCESIDSFYSHLPNSPNVSILHQWGIPLEKDAKTRSEKVGANQIKDFGNIGIGFAANGDGEHFGDFVGGGEALLFNQNNFRITKGNNLVKVKNKEDYWTFQVANFSKSNVRSIAGYNEEVAGRDDLKKMLKEFSAGRPFVAVFDAEFIGPFLARSNGIYKEDLEELTQDPISVFDSDIVGGHLIGGSDNQGDIESLKSYFVGKEDIDNEIAQQDFIIKFNSDILMTRLNEVRIASGEGFRKPRTNIQVHEAARLIQKNYRNYLVAK